MREQETVLRVHEEEVVRLVMEKIDSRMRELAFPYKSSVDVLEENSVIFHFFADSEAFERGRYLEEWAGHTFDKNNNTFVEDFGWYLKSLAQAGQFCVYLSIGDRHYSLPVRFDSFVGDDRIMLEWEPLKIQAFYR